MWRVTPLYGMLRKMPILILSRRFSSYGDTHPRVDRFRLLGDCSDRGQPEDPVPLLDRVYGPGRFGLHPVRHVPMEVAAHGQANRVYAAHFQNYSAIGHSGRVRSEEDRDTLQDTVFLYIEGAYFFRCILERVNYFLRPREFKRLK